MSHSIDPGDCGVPGLQAELNDIVSFRENAETTAAGHVTRVWDKPAGDPYVTISSEGRTFVRLQSEVTVTRKAATA